MNATERAVRRAHLRRKAALKAKCRSGKKRYRLEEQAQRAIDLIAKITDGRKKKPVRPYLCDHCAGWHLTSQATPLPPRSRKTAKVYRDERVPLVAAMLEERPWCEIRWDENCTNRATTVHEKLKRSRGGSILDPANCVTACAYCNGKVEDEPAEAQARGLADPTPPTRGVA